MTTAVLIHWILLPLLVLVLIVVGVVMMLEVEPWFLDTRGLGCFTIIVALVLIALLVF